MARGQITIPVAGELRSVAIEGRVASAEGIYDYNLQKSQEQINRELTQASSSSALANRVSQVETGLQLVQSTQGTQSSQISGISQSVSTLQGTQSSQGNQISQLQQDVQGIKNNPANKPTINKTWAEMIQLKNSNGFIPGQTYRITDFVTAGNAGTDLASFVAGYANHPFDIIVTALTANTIDEDARAALHSGDTYFANCQLEAWRLKYILDPANDPRKPVAYMNGEYRSLINSQTKGWIYFMKDEHLNSANYDFKNILVKGAKVTDFKYKDWVFSSSSDYKGNLYLKYINGISLEDAETEGNNEFHDGLYTVDFNSTKLFYLFSYLNADGSIIDASVKGVSSCFPYANKLSEVEVGSRENEPIAWQFIPMTNIFLCDWEWATSKGISLPAHNEFGQRTFGNTFGNEFKDNVFYHWSNNNVFGNSAWGNVFDYNTAGCAFGNYCIENSLTGHMDNISVGNLFQRNTAHTISNTVIGNQFRHNEIRSMNQCIFGNGCVQNSLPCWMANSTFGDEFRNNAGDGVIEYLVTGNNCYCNEFSSPSRVTMGNNCQGNRFSPYSSRITIGSSCNNNVFEGGNYMIFMGDYSSSNYFEKSSRYIIFGSSENNLKGYYYAVNIGPHNDHIILNCTATTSQSNRFIGIKVDTRTYSPMFDNSSTTNHPYKTISNNETEQGYTTTYTNSNSKTINV